MSGLSLDYLVKTNTKTKVLEIKLVSEFYTVPSHLL